MTVYYFLECLLGVTYINSFTHREFYFIIEKKRYLPSYTHLPLTLYRREQLHYLSIMLHERIYCPIFAARYPLSSLSKLLYIW